MQVRLDKWLSNQGYGSRREVNLLIRSGRVRVDGQVVTVPKTKVFTSACVQLDTQDIPYREYVYFLLHKPAGVLSATRDKRETVLDLLRPEDRVRPIFPAGRLDRDTTGLVLLTDDGPLAHAILSPRHHIEKEYFATLDGPVDTALVDRFREGILLEPEHIVTRPAQLSVLEDGRCRVVITEGKYHQIKRMFAAGGRNVLALHRHRVGPLVLEESLREGMYRPLTQKEVEALQDAAGQSPAGD